MAFGKTDPDNRAGVGDFADLDPVGKTDGVEGAGEEDKEEEKDVAHGGRITGCFGTVCPVLGTLLERGEDRVI